MDLLGFSAQEDVKTRLVYVWYTVVPFLHFPLTDNFVFESTRDHRQTQAPRLTAGHLRLLLVPSLLLGSHHRLNQLFTPSLPRAACALSLTAAASLDWCYHASLQYDAEYCSFHLYMMCSLRPWQPKSWRSFREEDGPVCIYSVFFSTVAFTF